METIDQPTSSFADADVLVLGSGYQTFTKNQVDIIADRCNSVTVLVRYNRFADIGEYLPLNYLATHRKSARIDRSDQPENVTVHALPLLYLPIEYHYRKMGDMHYEKAVKTLAQYEKEFDLIHAHFTWSSGYVAARLGQERDIPSVLTIHANENWLQEMYEEGHEDIYNTWRNIDAIIRVNEQDVSLLREYNDNVHSIPNGFSRSDYPLLGYESARESLGVSTDADVLFALGELTERKRFHHLVDAVDSLSASYPDLQCTITGRGEEKDNLQQQVSAADLDDSVSITGYLPQEEVAKWMNAADLFVLPSESEGNPTVMFEALGCGTPYVGTNVGGVDEIITSDEYGYIYPVDQPSKLPELIDKGLQTDWNRPLIREYGEQFTWERIMDRTSEVYRSVI